MILCCVSFSADGIMPRVNIKTPFSTVANRANKSFCSYFVVTAASVCIQHVGTCQQLVDHRISPETNMHWFCLVIIHTRHCPVPTPYHACLFPFSPNYKRVKWLLTFIHDCNNKKSFGEKTINRKTKH